MNKYNGIGLITNKINREILKIHASVLHSEAFNIKLIVSKSLYVKIFLSSTLVQLKNIFFKQLY